MTSDETKEKCKDCAYLIDDDVSNDWYCDDFDMYCEDVGFCEEWDWSKHEKS